jgi:PIN domain nuclease of toxin-antitoxin system
MRLLLDILIAQALQHSLTLVTVDDAVRAYPVPLLPAGRGQ